MDNLPSFIIIGAQRSGTTSLFNYLKQHPAIYPSFPNEVHFFDHNYSKGIDWYKSHFKIPLRVRIFKHTEQKNILFFESSPFYLFHPLVPKRVKTVLPNAKLIILLRNPSDRAYSHYQHELGTGYENLSFPKALEKETQKLKGEITRLRNEPDYISYNLIHFSYKTRGIYYEQINRWYKHFSKKNILIIKSESFYENAQKICNNVFDFLKINKHIVKVNKKFNQLKYTKMDDKIRNDLNKYFRAYNADLTKLIGKTFQWQ